MTQNSKQRFLAADELLSFRNHQTHRNKNTEKARVSAGKRFLKSGIPMSKDEYWKFSSPARFTSKELQNKLIFSDLNQEVIKSDDEINIFFVDGILDENLSDLQTNENFEIFNMNDKRASELFWVQELS
jgi:Fe-S cluster assembly protein SufD